MLNIAPLVRGAVILVQTFLRSWNSIAAETVLSYFPRKESSRSKLGVPSKTMFVRWTVPQLSWEALPLWFPAQSKLVQAVTKCFEIT